MEYVNAKIIKTGEETVLCKRMDENGNDVFTDTYGTKYKPEEVEELDLDEQPDNNNKERLGIDTAKILDNVLSRQDANFWRDQRMEIVKILLNRPESNFADPIGIVELADKYIQILKNYE